VDWDRFRPDRVDQYRGHTTRTATPKCLLQRSSDRQAGINTEFGMARTGRRKRTGDTSIRRRADVKGWSCTRVLLRIRERLNGDYIRDEALQDREITETLTRSRRRQDTTVPSSPQL